MKAECGRNDGQGGRTMETSFEIILPAETLDPPLTSSERVIRGALLLGFLAVMGTEAWLLWQVWRLIG
jgi:hypothetical protein